MRGANVISKPDCDAISRGKGREHNDDLYARAESSGVGGEEPAGLTQGGR